MIQYITTHEEEQTCETMIQDLELGIKEQQKAILGIDIEEQNQEYINTKWSYGPAGTTVRIG